MTVYCVDYRYNKDDKKEYYVMPYSFFGTLSTFFGFDIKSFRWEINYHPWYQRFKGFSQFVKKSHLSEKGATRVAERMDKDATNSHD